jgi:hypothetical protein
MKKSGRPFSVGDVVTLRSALYAPRLNVHAVLPPQARSVHTREFG